MAVRLARTKEGARKDGRNAFKRPSDRGWREPWTFAAARDALINEIQMLGGKNFVISTNYPLRRDGLPAGNGRKPLDEGVAVYFNVGPRAIAMASDRYHDAEGNMRSLALAIDAMRQLERHGGGTMMDRAFEGFAALPPPGGKPWWDVLCVPRTASPADINAAYRRLAAERHPDRMGGSEAMMADLNVARDAGLKGSAP